MVRSNKFQRACALALEQSRWTFWRSRQRQQPPKWHWVASIVIVLRVIARDSSVADDSIGTVDQWKQKYDTVRAAAEQAARRPASVGGHYRKRAWDDSASSTELAPEMTAPQLPAAHSHTGSGDDVAHVELLRMIRQAGEPQARHGYRDIAPRWLEAYLCLESAAELVRTYEPRLIPGLLQVEAYARMVLAQSRPDIGENESTRLVELRMRRQELLREHHSFRLWAIVDVAALRNEHANPQTMRSQITHLINISEQQNVTIQVLLPPVPDDHVVIKDHITIFRFAEKHIDDVVFLEQPQGGVFLRGRKEAEHYNHLMSRLGIRAVRADDARRVLREIFMEL